MINEYEKNIPNPNQSKVKIRKINEYKAFVMWNSIPKIYRGLTKDELIKLGIEEQFHELLEIGTNSEFAKRFGLSNDTLTDWRKLPQFESDIVNTVDRSTFQEFYARIVREFTLKTIEYGDAQRFVIWMQKFAGHIERFQSSPIDAQDDKDVVLPDDGTNIMKLVLNDIANNRGITDEEMKSIMGEMDDEVVVEELPSQQQYDFDKIEKMHRDKAAAKKSAESLPKKTKGDKTKEKIKIVSSVKKIAKKGIVKVKPVSKKKVVVKKKKKVAVKKKKKK